MTQFAGGHPTRSGHILYLPHQWRQGFSRWGRRFRLAKPPAPP